jgi:uncharacterized membrane protein (UPF0127 family)
MFKHMTRALSISLLLALGACETQAPTPPATAQPAEPTKPVTPVADAGTGAAAAPAGPEGVGRTCFNDLACNSYLRCVEKRCAIPGAVSGEHNERTPQVMFRSGRAADTEQLATFYVEIASTDSERERGLMYRRTMQDDWGMLFVYPQDGLHSFWMKNTYIPLDMIFLHSSGQVACIIEGAAPLTLEPRPCDKLSRYVLELNAGTARKRGVKIGAWMDVKNVIEEQRPLP